MAKKRANKRQAEIKKLDTVFSRWLRRSHADAAGRCRCVTCGVLKNHREMQAGHFQSRMKMSTRWLVPNVLPQCPKCNLYRQGEQYAFAQHLDRTYGKGTADEMTALSNQTRKWSVEEIEELRKEYEQKLRDLE